MTSREDETRISDRELVFASLAGRSLAYDELVRRYRGGVILVARQIIGSRELAEDVAQEAFLAALRGLSQLQDASRFAPWLYTITRNLARRAGRKQSRICTMDGAELDLLVSVYSPELVVNPLESLLNAEKDRAIRCFLDDLSPSLQLVLQLYYYEGWTVAQIATFTSLTQTTVKWRLHTGRKYLSRKLLQRQNEEEN